MVIYRPPRINSQIESPTIIATFDHFRAGCLLGIFFLAVLAFFPPRAVAQEKKVWKPPANLSRLGKKPDWNQLDKFQRTMTREEFVYLLDHCYARKKDEYAGYIIIEKDKVRIMRQSNYSRDGYYELYFKGAAEDKGEAETYWRTTYEMDDLPPNSSKPLQGIKIAIDPGHIGGKWVQWDDRHFKIGTNNMEVKEGELTLRVAKILERDLTALGAEVMLTRTSNNPVTEARPEDLKSEARAYLARKGKLASSGAIAATAKYMFSLSSEVQCRALLINESFQPDLALCLHFNASPWGRRPSLRSSNHLHLLINGCYTQNEIREDDTRYQMIDRLLQRIYYSELEMSMAVSKTMQEETRLPAFKYYGKWGKKVCDDRYVWARNLIANRSFMCPVIFLEPYCMNSYEVHSRIQEGEYSGLRSFGGKYRKNIYQEYADGVTSGLVKYFRKKRQ